ncbi:hypothetical protein ACET3X_001059 [Alternaria dauci]|uniref:Sister chromatid cohesion acetyltransferase Eco1 n=1 Tax=Alternaria dauci TaxID=48095 RepID=A0ABR3UWN4_9PLEO
MSSFGAKKVVRTYSRQTKRQLYDEEPPTKRRRVETTIECTKSTESTSLDAAPAVIASSIERGSSTPPPSSPKDSPAVFPDEPPQSSPPSSPVPRSSPPPVQKRRPVFSIFKKQLKPRAPTKEPLVEQDHNVQSSPKPAPKKKQMVQMQLDLASETRKTCKTCGMQYIPSHAEDAALHKKFHAMNVGGVDFTKSVVERFRKNQIWSGDGSFIAVVGRKDTLALRNRASDVLKVVNTELAAVPISDDELWGQTSRAACADATERGTASSKQQSSVKSEASVPLVDRFKIYLYIRGNKCVGACLAERIWEAHKVLNSTGLPEQEDGDAVVSQSSSISISTDSDSATLGISRIWTSNQHRKNGIATRLLDSARSDFLYGLNVEKAKVAFSQPTESGGNLARKWFGCQAGWHATALYEVRWWGLFVVPRRIASTCISAMIKSQSRPSARQHFLRCTISPLRPSFFHVHRIMHLLEDAAPPPIKTKKSVRILSPTTTIPPYPFDDKHVTLNELRARRSSQGPPASPPPPVTPAGYANSSVTAGEANAQVIGKDALAVADVPPSPSPYLNHTHATLSPSNVPANPFSRTLASLEPQERESDEERTNPGRPTLGSNRASLDVESFKNLLMTGKPTPRPSGPPAQPTSASQPGAGAQFETSSSTDTSSISRQSLFEHPQETHAESPRTSVDLAGSDEDDSMGLVSEVQKGKKKPPPAPKHRHGKLVTQRQPQTVSFESFAATEPAQATSPPTRRTDSSDIQKPLPPTPVAVPQSLHISTQDTTPLQSPPTRPTPSQPSTPSEGPIRQKKTPPPVPLARRQSQLKTTTTGNRSRSSSNLTISSQHSVDAPQSPGPNTLDPLFGAKSPPPPPPSRHGARLANLGNSSANSSSTELPQRSSSGRMPRSVPEPPSSRRSTLESQPSSPAPSVHRTSSISSTRNTYRNFSGESTGSNMPPPPPPPRRGHSNRSSLDQQRPHMSYSSPTESRRTSIEYRRTSTEQRRSSVASESSLRRTYAPVDEKSENEHALYSPIEESEARLGLDENVSSGKEGEGRSDSSNILDDMEKFQREIDELRTRYKQAG